MADQFQLASSGNWWDSSSTSFHSGPKPASAALSSTGSFGWSTEMVDMKTRSCMDSISVSAGSSMEFADLQKLQAGHESSSCGLMTDQNLPIMGLGLSSQGIDWNQAVFSDEKTESNSFRTMLQGNGMSSNTNFQQDSVITSSQDHQWRQKIYTTSPDNSSHISSNVESTVTCQGLAAMDSAAYGNPTMLQGLLASDNQPQKSSFGDGSMNYSYPSSYAMNTGDFMMPNWSKFPQLKGTAAAMNDVQPSFFPSLQQAQVPTPIFREKQKTTSEVRTLYTRVKKTSSETSTKRPRNDTTSTLPTCKVRKEKMGDRITALQQLVSPFGKTDTASVLSEAIEYIKFLHDQVSALSTPYMKSGASIQHHQSFDKSKNPEGPKLDLKSRGLCFVPISSTFPITHETAVDFWTPTLGGTFG